MNAFLLLKIAEQNQQESLWDKVKGYAVPIGAGLGTLWGMHKLRPKLVDYHYNSKLNELKSNIDSKLKNIDFSKEKEKRLELLQKEKWDLSSKNLKTDDPEEISRRGRRIDEIEEEMDRLDSLSPEELKNHLKKDYESTAYDNARLHADKMNNLYGKAGMIGALGVTYGAHKLVNNNNNLEKTSEDKDDKYRNLRSTATSAAQFSVLGAIPGANNIAGFGYGLKEGHPIVGLLGGPTAVEGAKSKNSGQSALPGALLGGAVAGGVYGAYKSDKMKDRIETLMRENAHRLVDKNADPEKEAEEAIKTMRQEIGKGHTAAIGAGLGLLGGGISYGFGRLFGSKKDKQ